MLSYLNFAVLLVSSFLLTFFYLKSAGPAALEKKIGPSAYQKCATWRALSAVFMIIVAIHYVVYYWFPLPLPLPRTFPWPYWVSALIGIVIAIPASYIMYRGLKDAGEETMIPKQEHTMYKGIYTRIRHPQAIGEVSMWWTIAFLVHSPFLVLFSFVYLPVWYSFCVVEERDLVIRYGAAFEEYQKKTGFWLPKK